jgi:hypothetical protein
VFTGVLPVGSSVGVCVVRGRDGGGHVRGGRTWVLDSCGQQPDQFATGSDDGTVKMRAAAMLC